MYISRRVAKFVGGQYIDRPVLKRLNWLVTGDYSTVARDHSLKFYSIYGTALTCKRYF